MVVAGRVRRPATAGIRTESSGATYHGVRRAEFVHNGLDVRHPLDVRAVVEFPRVLGEPGRQRRAPRRGGQYAVADRISACVRRTR